MNKPVAYKYTRGAAISINVEKFNDSGHTLSIIKTDALKKIITEGNNDFNFMEVDYYFGAPSIEFTFYKKENLTEEELNDLNTKYNLFEKNKAAKKALGAKREAFNNLNSIKTANDELALAKKKLDEVIGNSKIPAGRKEFIINTMKTSISHLESKSFVIEPSLLVALRNQIQELESEVKYQNELISLLK